MALPKLVKEGGSFYKGHKLVISADTGEYVLDMTETTATALNGIVIIPSKSGPGDTIKLEHLNASNERVSLLVEDLANIGVEMKINNMLLKEAYNLDFKEDDTIGE